MLIIYSYGSCSTCKKALVWLRQHDIEVTRIDIVKEPPGPETLARVLERTGLPIRKLFNTSGQAYRDGNYTERLKTLTVHDALRELSANGKLIKRPLLIGPTFAIVGYDEARYEQTLLK